MTDGFVNDEENRRVLRGGSPSVSVPWGPQRGGHTPQSTQSFHSQCSLKTGMFTFPPKLVWNTFYLASAEARESLVGRPNSNPSAQRNHDRTGA